MQYLASVLRLDRIALAAILVDPGQTFPESGARVIADAQRHCPTLPIILLSPRIGGFSRSFAHFHTITKGEFSPTSRCFYAYRPMTTSLPNSL